MIEIKKANLEDAQILADIHVASKCLAETGLVSDAYLQSLTVEDYVDKWQEWLGLDKSRTDIAYCEGNPAGFISYGPIRTRLPSDRGMIPQYAGEVYALYVHPDYLRKGIGRHLLLSARKDMAENKMKSFLLWVLKNNDRAVKFYLAQGGEKVGKKQVEIGGKMVFESAVGWRE